MTCRPSRGGINAGALTVSNSTFSGNSAGFGVGGGAICANELTAHDSVFDGNGGGAIFLGNGTHTITDSTITHNTGDGGGILNEGTLTVKDSTITGNTAFSGGGIYTCCGGTPPTLMDTLVTNNTPNDIAP